MMLPSELFQRFTELQKYVGWSADDAERIRAVAEIVRPHFPAIIDDFYEELDRHEETRRVITGGPPQIQRLKGTLQAWLADVFSGTYDDDYVARHWRIGRRHVEIGLSQVYVFAALARLRLRLSEAIRHDAGLSADELAQTLGSLNKMLDLDLALIEDAYDQEYAARKEAAERRRSDDMFRSVVDSAGCVIAVLREDRSIAFINSFTEEITGIAAADCIGFLFRNRFLVQEDRERFGQHVERALDGEFVRGFEARMLVRGGEARSFLWNIRAIDRYENVRVLLAVGQDVSTLHEAQTKALQAERLAVVGRMSAGLAHEARNTLQRIQACSEMLEFEIAGNAEALDLIRRIQQAQDHLHRMFDEVRGYAGPIQLDLASAPLSEAWREAWQLLGVLRQGRDARLTERIETDELCQFDHFRMVQLFRNLFENSLAACSDPAEITVMCRARPRQNGTMMVVAVCDNGPGFTSEQRRRIFEPFYTTKSKGTGLGMAIAQRIVEAHRGQIVVGHDWKHGAEIVVELPLEQRT